MNKKFLLMALLGGGLCVQNSRAQTDFAIINSDVTNKEMITGALGHAKIYIADGSKNAEQIINEIAQQNQNTVIKNLMVFGHGESGQFNLGSTVVNSQNLMQSLYSLNALKAANHLESIYLYGCNVAKGTNGQTFVDQLSQKLNVNVKASTNVTGKGGDWKLEYGNAPENMGLNVKNLKTYASSLQTVLVPGYTVTNWAGTQFVNQIAVDHAGKNIYYCQNSTTTGLFKFDIAAGTFTTVNANWTAQVNCFLPYLGTDIEYYNGSVYAYSYHNISAQDSLVRVPVSGATASITSFPSPPTFTAQYEAGAAIIGNQIYLTDGNLSSTRLLIYDFIAKTTSTINVGLATAPYETLEYCNATNELFFANPTTLFKVNLSSLTTTSVATLPGSHYGQFAIDPNGLYAYCQDGSNLYKVTLANNTNTIIVNGLGGNNTQDLEFGPSTGTACASGNDVSLYIGKGNTIAELSGFSKAVTPVTISNLTYCAGSTFKLPYVAFGNFCAGNIFTAELSDAVGGFATPLAIGSNTSTIGADTLLCTLPSTLTTGTGYKIRINASNPSLTGNASAMTLTINALPLLTVSGNNAVCIGSSITQTASGATTYSWNTGATTSSISVTPTVNTTYTVTGTTSGCSNSTIKTITVNPLPTLSVAGPTATCIGSSVIQTASGAATYTWNTTAITASVSLSPTVTTVYTVTGTDANNCVNSTTTSVTVNNLPAVTATVVNATICNGSSTTLNAGGATTYSWNTGATTASVSVNPTSNTNYTVTGTDANGCNNTATTSVTVNALPTLSVAGTSSLICAGESATLTVSGASTYTWNTTATTSFIVVSPTVTTTYTVNGTDANGCVNMTTITQNVSGCVGITESALPFLSSIYPNPNNGSFKLTVGVANENLQLMITNTLGQIIHQQSLIQGENTININSAKGIYHYTIRNTNAETIKGKLIIE